MENASQDIRHSIKIRAHIYDINIPSWDSVVRFEMPTGIPRTGDGHWEMISFQMDGEKRIEYSGSRFSIAPQFGFEPENENATVELVFVEYVD